MTGKAWYIAVAMIMSLRRKGLKPDLLYFFLMKVNMIQ